MSALVLGLALGAMPGCKKNKDTDVPGGPKGVSRETLERAIEKAKHDAKVEEIIVLANKDLASGRYVSAQKRAEEALKENPEDANAYAVLGAASWRAGDFEASTTAYRKAVELDPKNYGGALGLARNLQAIGQHLEAIELANKLLAEDKEQIEPRLAKLWSHYELCQSAEVVAVTDEVFAKMPTDDPLLPLVQAYAAFMRPLAEHKNPLCTVKGDAGGSNLELNLDYGFKSSGAVVNEQFTTVIWLEGRVESVIDPGLVKQLKLKPVGKYKPVGSKDDSDIVVVPSVKFGKISLENIPAVVQPLGDYAAAFGGETPGMMLGKQAMNAFGAIGFDFPGSTVELAKAPPKGSPEGAVELTMPFISTFTTFAPVIPLGIEGSDHHFFAYMGGLYPGTVAVSKKHYLKSGKLPRDVENPDDPSAGLKMVYLISVDVGSQKITGVGGLVLVNEPADATLDHFLHNALFEIGGFVSVRMLKHWKVTYALQTGKVYIKT